MPLAPKKIPIMIVAGEASGDMHGARLVAAIRSLLPQAEFSGIGGPALAAEGVAILYDASRLAVVGIIEVLRHFRFIRQAMAVLERQLAQVPPQLLILIDYPDFNFHLAKKAKRLGIPVFYYISPQVWAWRSGRVQTIRRLVDRLAVILPFEEEFYRKNGMVVHFVGHPLLDAMETGPPRRTRQEYLASLGIDPASMVVGILPGSRKREVAAMLPTFLAAARLIRARLDRQKLVFVLPLAPTLSEADLLAHGLAESDLDLRLVREDRYEVMAACRGVLAASGTVSLELAILNVPMLIAYRVSPLTYILGRLLVKVRFASLVNLIVGREVVPELLQDQASPEAIAERAVRILADGEEREGMLAGLAELRQGLGGPGASLRAAGLALDLLKVKDGSSSRRQAPRVSTPGIS